VGQGTQLGCALDQLAWLTRRFDPQDVGICVDTCHVHAAGIALDSAAAATRLLDRIDRLIGRERLAAIHLNDSVHAAGERRDRHAGIGEGTISPEAFGALMRARRLQSLPGILETPKGARGELDACNIRRLNSLRSRGRPNPNRSPR
jgi:deoxyribonuclease-4